MDDLHHLFDILGVAPKHKDVEPFEHFDLDRDSPARIDARSAGFPAGGWLAGALVGRCHSRTGRFWRSWRRTLALLLEEHCHHRCCRCGLRAGRAANGGCRPAESPPTRPSAGAAGERPFHHSHFGMSRTWINRAHASIAAPDPSTVTCAAEASRVRSRFPPPAKAKRTCLVVGTLRRDVRRAGFPSCSPAIPRLAPSVTCRKAMLRATGSSLWGLEHSLGATCRWRAAKLAKVPPPVGSCELESPGEPWYHDLGSALVNGYSNTGNHAKLGPKPIGRCWCPAGRTGVNLYHDVVWRRGHDYGRVPEEHYEQPEDRAPSFLRGI